MGEKDSWPKVSVIIPVFKPGDAIKKCLESLQNQTLKDMEMIFVDDCGNDGSMCLIKKAAEKDKRIRIIRNEDNSGPGVSRNRGIEAAKGQYLGFVDSDDYVALNYFELLYNKAVITSEKIVRGTFATYNSIDGSVDERRGLSMLRNIEKGVSESKPLYSVFQTPFWCAIYLRAWIVDVGICFGKMNYSEDKIFLLQACHSAATMAIEEKAVYYYVQKSESLVHTLSEVRLRDSLEANEIQLNYILTNMRKEDVSAEYLIHLVDYPLVIQAAAARQDNLKRAADEFLRGLADEARRFPEQDKVKEKSKVITALIEYGENINIGRYWDETEENESAAYLDGVTRPLCFAISHPDRKDLYESNARKSIRNAIEFSLSLRKRDRKARAELQRNLFEILHRSNSNSITERKVRSEFIGYYRYAFARIIGHSVKKMIRKKKHH